MDSILDSMNNNTLIGKINDGIKTKSIQDGCPVFGGGFGFRYEDDDNWYHKEPIMTNLNHFMMKNDKEMPTIQSLKGLHQLHSGTEYPKDHICDKIYKLLSQNIHRKTSKRENLEEAIKLMEENLLTDFGHYCRGLVYFPDLLERYLKLHKEKGALISEDDIGCMIARCIEHSDEDTYAEESLKHLLNFKGDLSIEIKLLPGKYHIDDKLYQLVKSHNVQDSYYDAIINTKFYTYSHPDVVAKERTGQYTGYRDAYHCLLYGEKEHLQALIVRWDLWGPDRTADAVREYFNLDDDVPIEILISRINKRCNAIGKSKRDLISQ
jgi:hypothetical protein